MPGFQIMSKLFCRVHLLELRQSTVWPSSKNTIILNQTSEKMEDKAQAQTRTHESSDHWVFPGLTWNPKCIIS